MSVSVAQRVAEALRGGELVSDARFDSALPPSLRELSRIHFTPVAVACRAAQLLVRGRATRVLDVGSGIGKFCLVGALTTPGRFVGVEHKGSLSRAAGQLVRAFGVGRQVSCVEGDMADLDWSRFDAVYLYNPFYEALVPSIRVEGPSWPAASLAAAFRASAPDAGLFERSAATVTAKLRTVRPGTRVVTYHGFGGEFPGGFQRVVREDHASGPLELWVKGGRPENFILKP